MRTHDDKLEALIRAALHITKLGSDLAGAYGGLKPKGREAIEALDAALGEIDAHDLFMANAVETCEVDGAPAVAVGADGFPLCADCARWDADRGAWVEALR